MPVNVNNARGLRVSDIIILFVDISYVSNHFLKKRINERYAYSQIKSGHAIWRRTPEAD